MASNRKQLQAAETEVEAFMITGVTVVEAVDGGFRVTLTQACDRARPRSGNYLRRDCRPVVELALTRQGMRRLIGDLVKGGAAGRVAR